MKIFGIELKFNGFDVWHKGNQGSGSTLDADTVDGRHASDLANQFIIPSPGSTVTYYKIAELVTAIGSGENGGILYVNGTGDYGSNQMGLDILQFSTRNASFLRVLRLLKPGSGAVQYGYAVNGSSGNTEIWIQVATYNYGLDIFIGDNRALTSCGNLLSQTTVPAGIIWVTPTIIGDNGTGNIPISNGVLNTNLNADLLDGFHASQTAGSANTAVVRDSNGYIMNTWFNSNRGDEASAAASYIYDTGDGHMRKKSLANARAEIVIASDILTKMNTVDGPGSGLDADLLDGQHASAFALTTSVPTKLSALTNDSNFVTALNHQHFDIGVSDTRSVNHNGFDYQGITVHLKSNATDGLSDGGTYHGVLHLTQWADSSGGRAHQLGFTDNGNIWFRDWNGTTWSTWVKLAKTTDIPTKLSELTNDIGAGGGVKITTSTTAPASPSPGDFWYKEV